LSTQLPEIWPIYIKSHLGTQPANSFVVRHSAPKTKIVAAFGKRSSQTVDRVSPAVDPVSPAVDRVSPAVDMGTPDSTLEFASEKTLKRSDTAPRAPRFDRRQIAGAALGLIALVLITAGVYWKDRWQLPAAAAGGSLRIESDPAGAEVRLNGAAKGTTPLSLSVPAGSYSLTVQHGANIKELPVSVTNGETTVHHITWTDTPPPVSAETGNLSVATDPPGSDVIVDGQTRGVAPLTLRSLPVGQHRVVVRAGGTNYTRTVQIEAGATASLFFGGTQAAVPGSIAIASPVPVQVFQDQRLIGTSEMDRIMLPAGEHVLELAAETLGYRATRTVRVTAGQTVALAVDLPQAPLSINAIPWAEVFIDGTRVGETPLGNLPQRLGAHEIVFRHPQLGERRVNATVTLKETTRISIDMRQR
jgi:PEGA domain-containing protein